MAAVLFPLASLSRTFSNFLIDEFFVPFFILPSERIFSISSEIALDSESV